MTSRYTVGTIYPGRTGTKQDKRAVRRKAGGETSSPKGPARREALGETPSQNEKGEWKKYGRMPVSKKLDVSGRAFIPLTDKALGTATKISFQKNTECCP